MIKMSSKNRFLVFVIGILILTLGITLTILSDFGTSPFDALLVGLSLNVGLTVGSWEIIMALILVFCNSLLTQERPEVLGLLTAIITGVFIDMWLFLLRNIITPELWFSKLTCLTIGLVVIGLGTAIYLHTNFAPIPIDRLSLIITQLTNRSMLFSRTVINFVFFIVAMIFKGPIGVGTLLTVCFGGAILNYFMPLTKKVIGTRLTDSTSK